LIIDTPFSTHVGLAAGPYGDPNRFDPWSWGNMTVWDTLEGEFPRTISLFRTSYSFVATARANKPDELAMMWFSLHAPDTAPYTPLYVSSDQLPLSWVRGAMHVSYASTNTLLNITIVCLSRNTIQRLHGGISVW
jgi:dipeptidase